MSDSLAQLLAACELLERQIDESEVITPEQCEAHFSSIAAIDAKVDRLLGYMDTCKMKAAVLAERAKDLKDEGERWERRLEQLEKYALWLTDRFPDVSWRGTDFAFEKKLNPPSMVCSYKSGKSFSSYIPEAAVPLIAPEFLEQVTIWVLKSDSLKDALKAGKEFDFARLERKEKLNIKPKEKIK